ncbi:HAD family hydrolase [bacterium]|nr:HAD family hydrolase [bacterium]MCI0604859.1 HAD family hydrolase [bacterium]
MIISKVVFLFDVDNTLLDNDKVTADLKKYLDKTVGREKEERYWQFFEELRNELGYADYLGALQRYRVAYPRDPNLLCLSRYLISYPFANRLYPESLDAVNHVKQWGPAVIFSDGDAVFQPRKAERSGLYEVFDENVLIYIHKEENLDDVEKRYPAEHYALIDDKLRILHAIKQIWKDRVTTIFPKQGHYAWDPEVLRSYPGADISMDRIGNLMQYDLQELMTASTH